jgi:predicted enzyme related to lactoylglutathione lyase
MAGMCLPFHSPDIPLILSGHKHISGVTMSDSSTQGIKQIGLLPGGATVKEPRRDVGGGRLVATVTDPDGNVLGLLQDP